MALSKPVKRVHHSGNFSTNATSNAPGRQLPRPTLQGYIDCLSVHSFFEMVARYYWLQETELVIHQREFRAVVSGEAA